MPVGPIERAVDLLARVAEAPGEATVAELASDAGLPTSTAYRLLTRSSATASCSATRRHGRARHAGRRARPRRRGAPAARRWSRPAEPIMERLAREQRRDGDPDRAVRARGDRPAHGRGRARRCASPTPRTGACRCTSAPPARCSPRSSSGDERERLLAAAGDPGARGPRSTQIRERGSAATTRRARPRRQRGRGAGARRRAGGCSPASASPARRSASARCSRRRARRSAPRRARSRRRSTRAEVTGLWRPAHAPVAGPVHAPIAHRRVALRYLLGRRRRPAGVPRGVHARIRTP